MKKSPLISIVIPTRQRHETLKYTLQTILQQDFDDYEIIVSDNFSTHETRDIIDRLNSEKIKYIRSSSDLSLQDSWEQAVTNASGEYIMGIADNDGIIDGALLFLATLLEINKYPLLINFAKNTYNWPCLDLDIRNRLYFHKNPSLEFIDGMSLIKEVNTDPNQFYKLPMIYNSIVHNSLIEKMKLSSGRIFNSVTPDVYSGVCLAYLTKNYLYLSQPITIAGNSAKSLGVNFTNNHNADIVKKEVTLVKQSNRFHPWTAYVMSHSSRIYDVLLRAKEHLKIDNLIIERKKIVEKTISDLIVYGEDSLYESKAVILKSCEDDPELFEYCKSILNKRTVEIFSKKPSSNIFGFNNDKLCLNGEDFGLTNILDVSKFMAKFYDYTLHVINYPQVLDDFSNLKKDAKIAIWGNGQYGKDLQNSIKSLRSDLEVAFIIDSFKESLDSKPIVVTPDKIYNVDYIIIASMFVLEIVNTINGLDFDKSIKVLKYAKGMW